MYRKNKAALLNFILRNENLINISESFFTRKRRIKRVAIIGSCVTRDCFNSKINPGYKELFDVAVTCHQSSLVSQMSPPVTVPSGLLEGASNWAQKTLLTDIEKSFATDLSATEVDLIIVDLRSDISSGVAIWQNSYVTPIRWHIAKTEYGATLAKAPKLSPKIDMDAYTEKFIISCIKFRYLIKTTMPNAKIILNTVKASADMISNDGTIIKNRFNVERDNKLWAILDRIFLEQIPEAIPIKAAERLFSADQRHPWGESSVHFTPEYYSTISKKFAKIR